MATKKTKMDRGVMVDYDKLNISEIFHVALLLGVKPDEVVGLMVRVWIWGRNRYPKAPETPQILTKEVIKKVACGEDFLKAMLDAYPEE